MPFHTVAWRLSTTTAVETDITPVQDNIMLIQNGHFVPQQPMSVLYASVGAATPTSARFISPTLRQLSTPWVRPLATAIVQGVEPHVRDYRSNPLGISALEELELAATQTSGGSAVIAAVAGLSIGPVQPAPAGTVITMSGTGTTTAVAGSWTACPATWQDTLPAGQYACVGLEFEGATAISARLIFDQQYWRPGTVGVGTLPSRVHPMFQVGGLGVWGTFTANRMPNVEILCNAADTAQQFYLDFIRIG